jgi:D-arabinose 1-dehydrogenase-like Zn-dependent alcohol dehydrogenase
VGPTVQDKWKVGQRVGALLFRHQCHSCLGCKINNDIRFCENIDFAGLKADGGMAEYFIADGNNSVLLPDEVDFVNAAPLMCAGVSFNMVVMLEYLVQVFILMQYLELLGNNVGCH